MEEEEEAPLAPPAGRRDASRRAAAAPRPIGAPPPLVRSRLPSRLPLVCQLVVASPLLSRRRRLCLATRRLRLSTRHRLITVCVVARR